jgi:hypothetical protein
VTQPGPAAGPPPITIGGIAPEKRLVTAVHDLAARVVTRLTEQIPVYASLPAEQLRGDITAITVRGIRGFAQALRTGEPPTAAQLELMHRSAARRAEERIPLDAVVGAYFLGAHECLGHVLADAGPDDLADVLAAQRLLLRYLNAVTESVFAGYIAESQAALGEQQSARQALLSALLDGGPARQAAERAGLRLPAAYWVVSLAAAAHPDEHTQGVDPAIAAGRKLRRMRAELDRQAHGAVLSALSPDGGLVLVPAAAGPDDLTDADWERLTALVRHVERASGAELTAAAAAAPPQDVPAAARLAAQVRQVAGGCGRGPGLYRLEDVLLEYQLTLPSPARDRLAALLAPLDGRDDLLDTLRTFLATGLDRRRTAERLHIHPNTVDYRLRRATALTGLSATHGPDLPKIQAALAAHGAWFSPCSNPGTDPR